MEGYWDECLALPSKLKDWDAYHDLKTSLQNYLEVFPLLRKLNSKVTIATISSGDNSCRDHCISILSPLLYTFYMLLFFNRLHASYIFFKNPNELYILFKKILIASACLIRIIKKKNNVNFPILLFLLFNISD